MARRNSDSEAGHQGTSDTSLKAKRTDGRSDKDPRLQHRRMMTMSGTLTRLSYDLRMHPVDQVKDKGEINPQKALRRRSSTLAEILKSSTLVVNITRKIDWLH